MIWYLVGINLITFVIYGVDKYNAVHKKYRVSEKSIFTFSVIGGNIGAIMGMRFFHHKTRKASFWIINILSLIMWLIILIESNK